MLSFPLPASTLAGSCRFLHDEGGREGHRQSPVAQHHHDLRLRPQLSARRHRPCGSLGQAGFAARGECVPASPSDNLADAMFIVSCHRCCRVGQFWRVWYYRKPRSHNHIWFVYMTGLMVLGVRGGFCSACLSTSSYVLVCFSMFWYVLVCLSMSQCVLVCRSMFKYVLTCLRKSQYVLATRYVLVCLSMSQRVLACLNIFLYVLVCLRMSQHVFRSMSQYVVACLSMSPQFHLFLIRFFFCPLFLSCHRSADCTWTAASAVSCCPSRNGLATPSRRSTLAWKALPPFPQTRTSTVTRRRERRSPSSETKRWGHSFILFLLSSPEETNT